MPEIINILQKFSANDLELHSFLEFWESIIKNDYDMCSRIQRRQAESFTANFYDKWGSDKPVRGIQWILSSLRGAPVVTEMQMRNAAAELAKKLVSLA